MSNADNKILSSVSSFTALFPTVESSGASLTGFTVTVMVCESASSLSETERVNVSLPLKFSGALNVTVLPSRTAEMSVPSEILYVKLSPSISLADKVILPEISSSKPTSETAASTGASFTGKTEIDRGLLSDSSPSETETFKDKLPL